MLLQGALVHCLTVQRSWQMGFISFRNGSHKIVTAGTQSSGSCGLGDAVWFELAGVKCSFINSLLIKQLHICCVYSSVHTCMCGKGKDEVKQLRRLCVVGLVFAVGRHSLHQDRLCLQTAQLSTAH